MVYNNLTNLVTGDLARSGFVKNIIMNINMQTLLKRMIALLLILVLLSITACGKIETAETAASVSTAAPVSEPEVTPNQPESTPEPTQIPVEETHTANPTAQGIPFILSDSRQYAANLSLSNFSEQWFCEIWAFDHYDAADTSIAQLYMFAHLWNKINRPTAMEYKDGYETMTRDTFYEIITPRIDYPDDLQPTEGEDFSAAFGIGNFDWNHSWYENGRFYYPAGDGESYNRFTVVDEAYKINDWTYRFRFTIYELDLQIYWDELGIPLKYYRLSPSEAAQYAARGEITAKRTGTAVCSPIYWESSGREMYRLEYYELDHTN